MATSVAQAHRFFRAFHEFMLEKFLTYQFMELRGEPGQGDYVSLNFRKTGRRLYRKIVLPELKYLSRKLGVHIWFSEAPEVGPHLYYVGWLCCYVDVPYDYYIPLHYDPDDHTDYHVTAGSKYDERWRDMKEVAVCLMDMS